MEICRKNITRSAFVSTSGARRAVAKLVIGGANADGKRMRRHKPCKMFQPLIAGSEIGRGYSELNDPIDQKNRFEERTSCRRRDMEAMMPDDGIRRMLEHAIRPACGCRLRRAPLAYLSGSRSADQMFPLISEGVMYYAEKSMKGNGQSTQVDI